MLKNLMRSIRFPSKLLFTSYNSAMIVLFGVLLLSILWIGVYYKVQSERQMVIDGVFKEAGNLARSFEEHSSRTIKGADETALFLKYQYEKVGKDIEFDINQYIKEGLFIRQPFVLLSIINENGDLTVSSQVPFVPVNLSDREHFFVHKEYSSEQLFISKPVRGRASGKCSIQMTRRINHPDGSFGGVVVVSVDPSYFSDFYKQVELGGNSIISLIGRDGVIRAQGGYQEQHIGINVGDSPLMKYLQSSNKGHFINKSIVDGVNRIYSYHALPDYPLVVLVGIDEEEAFKAFNQRVVSYYYISTGITFIIIVFIVLLLSASERQKRDAQALKRARDNLQIKVRKRTQKLFTMNEELRAMNEEHVALNEELRHNNEEIQKEIVDRKRIECILKSSQAELTEKNKELTIALETVKRTRDDLIRQEKLAGIGQLAAGVAHEINNPLGFITNNIETLEQYYTAFRSILAAYQEISTDTSTLELSEKIKQIRRLEREQELDYILHDLPELFKDTNEGLERICKIVKGIGVFSRIDQEEAFAQYDLHKGLENTLLMACNELKHNAVVEKNLGEIPKIEAIGSEINQVLLNLIVNAVHALKEKNMEEKGQVKIATWCDTHFVFCRIEDNGIGILPENLKQIFNPFFTTKPVGQGTGIGLSISYDIIVNRHHGDILVESDLGKGTQFTILLPIKQQSTKNMKDNSR